MVLRGRLVFLCCLSCCYCCKCCGCCHCRVPWRFRLQFDAVDIEGALCRSGVCQVTCPHLNLRILWKAGGRVVFALRCHNIVLSRRWCRLHRSLPLRSDSSLTWHLSTVVLGRIAIPVLTAALPHRLRLFDQVWSGG